jgi:hypothetical protein
MTGFAAAVVPLLDDPDDDVLLPAVVEEPELDDPLDPEEEPLDPEEELLDPEEAPLLLVELPELAVDVLDDPAFFLAEVFDFELLLPVAAPPWPLPPEPPLPPCEPDASPAEP